MPHYWLTCFFIPVGTSFIKEGNGTFLESLISHIVILTTSPLSVIKYSRNSFLIFKPKKLTISKAVGSTSVAFYLDLLFTTNESSSITTQLYDKHDAFNFHIVNIMSRNVPSSPAYGVYASQLICYARCCSNYSDFYHVKRP